MWNSQPRFDQYQFANRRAFAVSARTGISFQDYGSMHTERYSVQRERRLETPAWALNDAELREVVLKYCERRFYLTGRRKQIGLTYEQRLTRIRETELRYAKERLRPSLHQLIKRQMTEPTETRATLDSEIQNVDSQINLLHRGSAAVAARVVYLYHRCGWHSVQVANEVGIKPPLVRQMLARLAHAANGTVYCSPKQQRIREARAQMNHINKLFAKVKKLVDTTNREAKQQELKAAQQELKRMMPKVKHQPNQGRTWTYDRLMFVYFLRLQGISWNRIAPKLGIKHADSLQTGFKYYTKNMYLLPDFKRAA